jgi:signal transduction histidine kinase
MPLRSGDPGIFFPNEASCWCALLCDNDGHVILDFGERRSDASASIPARTLIGLIESGSLADFLESVRTCGVTRGWEMRIHYGGSALRILLHGFQTPQGILVFAPLPPYPAKQADVLTSDFRPLAPLRAGRAMKRRPSLFEVAHELQNPISSIIGACEYLATYYRENLNSDQSEMISGIESSAATLLRLSRRLSEAAPRRVRRASGDAASSK